LGPRQVGKTTLVQDALKNDRVLAYDLLASTDYFRLLARPSLFAEELVKARGNIDFVVIDEIQRVPALLDEVHRFLEGPSP
jgi:predicted AAA+ superfamily ATPase